MLIDIFLSICWFVDPNGKPNCDGDRFSRKKQGVLRCTFWRLIWLVTVHNRKSPLLTQLPQLSQHLARVPLVYACLDLVCVCVCVCLIASLYMHISLSLSPLSDYFWCEQEQQTKVCVCVCVSKHFRIKVFSFRPVTVLLRSHYHPSLDNYKQCCLHSKSFWG